MAEFTGHLNTKYRIDNELLSNDSYIVSGSEDGNIYIWSLLESKIQAKLQHPHKVVHTLNVHPSSLELISAAENTVYLWSLKQEE